MQIIDGRLVNVVQEVTRTDAKKPYKVLQLLNYESGLIHTLHGEVVSVTLGKIDGSPCQFLKLLISGKYFKALRVVDYDLERKHELGSSIMKAVPRVRVKDGKSIIIYELTKNQTNPENSIHGDVYLIGINDYFNRDWHSGDVQLAVDLSSWGPDKHGRTGLNYKVAEQQE